MFRHCTPASSMVSTGPVMVDRAATVVAGVAPR
jgi:hypothetical protein